MSLLLDALKRAEQEKLAKQGDRPANDATAPAPAAPAAAARRESAKAAALELQPIASQQTAPQGKSAAGAATAQAVFQAKAPAQTAEGKRNLTMLWIIGGIVIVAILVIGGYVWWSLTSLQPRPLTTLRPRTVTATTPQSGQAKNDTLVPGAMAPATPPRSDVPAGPIPMPPAAPTPPPASGTASPVTTLPARGAPPSAAPPDLASQLVRDAPATPSLKLTPAEKPRVPTEIAMGYDALRSGDLPAARRSYAAALIADPASLDAHLGSATIEARLGNTAAAASHYRRVLDLDPRNATALAGLASIADMSQPEMLEGQLRADIARYPQSAALHFALGNLYASRRRWEEAQGAYFEALRIEPASSDTLYNLAVAMDHMGQQRLAADYYRRALEASRGQTAQFDPAQVARRLAELRP